ncbi:MAG: molecular chaperone HtpG, partial [Gammaproteobacteria bacterium]|nr:molecular chaperone HtpG [Gammaproteobacteria bacterium]
LLTDPIDEWVTSHLTEFDGKQFRSVMKGDLDIDELEGKTDDSDTEKQDEENQAETELTKKIKEVLGEQVKDVRITRRLTTSPACLVSDMQDMGRHLQQILQASGQQMPEMKPILEINPSHPLVMMLEDSLDSNQIDDWSHILFDQALLSEGGKLEDPATFVKRLNAIFMEMGEKQP